MRKHVSNLKNVALFCLGIYIAINIVNGSVVNFNLDSDYIINGHWLPNGTTLFWVLGMLFGSFALMYHASKISEMKLLWLVDLGQSALPLYVLHILIIAIIADRIVGVNITQWWGLILFNTLLLLLLVLTAKALKSDRVRTLLKQGTG